MYEILFYRDQNDIEPVKEYLLSLAQNESKDSRIKLNKIRDYVTQTAQQRLSELKERLKNE
ncbi:shikimate dehydrogenase [Haemophilus influenzae]|uniref:shikimate dehydrogenase n=1 Tax=Haemophilus influenzae TaxID=727 RepID=UPI0005AF0663|nr:shikimate dehydrogenase [Haemophilus influenzae]AXP60738.1 shikimate dehydrogenase [Haemophilus influenzae]KIP50126.1 shikimate dehydrogenase [Haemophilus influenzae]MCK9682755.1 shikimate dehydrogenase [Haemophilus influenzae]RFN95629.1 shikimate dehydrogenase [Haemophilus influenzae]